MMSIMMRKLTKNTPTGRRLLLKYGGKFLTRGEPYTCVEGKNYDGRLVILEPNTSGRWAWFNDPDYQEAMTFRHAASTMNYLSTRGSANTEDPDPKL